MSTRRSNTTPIAQLTRKKLTSRLRLVIGSSFFNQFIDTNYHEGVFFAQAIPSVQPYEKVYINRAYKRRGIFIKKIEPFDFRGQLKTDKQFVNLFPILEISIEVSAQRYNWQFHYLPVLFGCLFLPCLRNRHHK